MVSDPDTVVRKVLDSQHSGATAVVTAEAQVPMMAATLSTSTSLRGADRGLRIGLVVLAHQLDLAAEDAAGAVHLLDHPLHRLAHGGSIGAAGAGEWGQRAQADGRTLRGGAPGAQVAAARAAPPASKVRREMPRSCSIIDTSPRRAQ